MIKGSEIKVGKYTMTKIGMNLYRCGNKYFRLFADGMTPNGCWLINPEMRQLMDINAADGIDVFGELRLEIEVGAGMVGAENEFIRK